MTKQIFYGFHEDIGEGRAPDYDPPHDAPCLYCGRRISPDDVRTRSLKYTAPSYAKRSYFYRTHKSCDEKYSGLTAMDGFILDMIARNGD